MRLFAEFTDESRTSLPVMRRAMVLKMASYSLHSIDQTAFDEFVVTPSETQLHPIVNAINESDSEGEKWTAESVALTLAQDVWYERLDEFQMFGWDRGLDSLLERPEFDLRVHGVHCSISDMFIELASLAYADRGVDAIARRFWPYHFFDICVRTRIGRDPTMDRFEQYFPSHALLTNAQVGQLLDETSQYPLLLQELADGNQSFVEKWRLEIDVELKEAVPALMESHNEGRMWYSMFDYWFIAEVGAVVIR
jgi:hypothetical protein